MKAKIQWQNKWRHNLNVHCNNHNGIVGSHSVYNAGQKDRVWNWPCRRVSESPQTFCHWSGDENAETGNMNFTCPTNQILNGVHSYYVPSVTDRRWRFYCCSFPGYSTTNCYTTQLANTGHEQIYHVVGAPRVFIGASSIYNRHNRWVILYLENQLHSN